MATTVTGTLKGLDTEDNVRISVKGPATVHYTVRHNGKGNNALRVRTQSYTVAIWGEMQDFEVQPGRSATRTIAFDWDTTPNTFDGEQDFRFKLSRTVGSKEIPWEVSWWVGDLEK